VVWAADSGHAQHEKSEKRGIETMNSEHSNFVELAQHRHASTVSAIINVYTNGVTDLVQPDGAVVYRYSPQLGVIEVPCGPDAAAPADAFTQYLLLSTRRELQRIVDEWANACVSGERQCPFLPPKDRWRKIGEKPADGEFTYTPELQTAIDEGLQEARAERKARLRKAVQTRRID
jgi:hypothetical protein